MAQSRPTASGPAFGQDVQVSCMNEKLEEHRRTGLAEGQEPVVETQRRFLNDLGLPLGLGRSRALLSSTPRPFPKSLNNFTEDRKFTV